MLGCQPDKHGNKLKDIDVRLNMMARTKQSITVLGIRDYIFLCRRIREGRYSKEQISQRLSKNWEDLMHNIKKVVVMNEELLGELS